MSASKWIPVSSISMRERFKQGDLMENDLRTALPHSTGATMGSHGIEIVPSD
jgi:hypothetical protein